VNDLNSCHFCGRYVLQVPGWTTHLESLPLLRSPWDAESSFLTGLPPLMPAGLPAQPHIPRGRPPPVYFT